MCKLIKSGLSVISAHAAFADTTERHGAGGKMDDGIVDTATAEVTAVKDFLLSSFVFTEEIQCQQIGRASCRERVSSPV